MLEAVYFVIVGLNGNRKRVSSSGHNMGEERISAWCA